MPELPEVEIIAKSLDRAVKKRTIMSARLLRERLAPDIRPASFARRLKGRMINFVHRRGKHILFDCTGDTTLIVHLRMSGRFSLLDSDSVDPKFTHAILYFDNGTRLVFDDQRHFGMMKITRTSALDHARELNKLAPEPFSPAFSPEYLFSTLKTSRRSLKEFLLDQTKVCGLGNIYAAEAMFAAGVHPATLAYKVKEKKAHKLHTAVIDVLRIAISSPVGLEGDANGPYFSGDGSAWMVYGREGEACRVCGTPITRLKQGGRSTYLCRKCQRK